MSIESEISSLADEVKEIANAIPQKWDEFVLEHGQGILDTLQFTATSASLILSFFPQAQALKWAQILGIGGDLLFLLNQPDYIPAPILPENTQFTLPEETIGLLNKFLENQNKMLEQQRVILQYMGAQAVQ